MIINPFIIWRRRNARHAPELYFKHTKTSGSLVNAIYGHGYSSRRRAAVGTRNARKSVRKTMAGIFVFMFIIAGFSAKADDAPRKHEADYVQHWCDAAGGQEEYRLPDRTRVDCLLDDYAVEFDWSHKWGECIGQAAFYGEMTNRVSACVLVKYRTDTFAKFYRYAKRARTAAKRAQVIVVCMNTAGEEIQCGKYADKENLNAE